MARRGAVLNRPIRQPAWGLPRALPGVAWLLVALVATACAGPIPTPAPSRGGPSGSAPPGSSPAASSGPTVGAIEHRTGATDVILRIEQGGGFVPIDFLATQAPGFTLYGNGVIVFQQATPIFPQPDANGVVKGVPWRTASLDERQIQDLLEFALGRGGLGTARELYMANGVADAPDTIFTIHAGGVDKTVVVNALGIDSQSGPDSVARAAFSALAARLRDFDRGGSIGSDVYQAERYRGVLTQRDAATSGAVQWPWPAIDPAAFKPGPNDGTGGPTLPHRTMSPADVAILGLPGIEGGIQGLTLRGPDGKTYGFILRPLLVDEKE